MDCPENWIFLDRMNKWWHIFTHVSLLQHARIKMRGTFPVGLLMGSVEPIEDANNHPVPLPSLRGNLMKGTWQRGATQSLHETKSLWWACRHLFIVHSNSDWLRLLFCCLFVFNRLKIWVWKVSIHKIRVIFLISNWCIKCNTRQLIPVS